MGGGKEIGPPRPELSLDHDAAYEMLCEWLRKMPKLCAPHVKDTLFMLSDYVSRKVESPPNLNTLTFLHAYIFALEHTVCCQAEEIERLKKSDAPLRQLKRIHGG